MGARSFTPNARNYIRIRDKDICLYCKLPASTQTGEIAHVIPASRGGPSTPNNAIWSHKICNRAQSNRITFTFLSEAFDYLQSKGEDITWYTKGEGFLLVPIKGDLP